MSLKTILIIALATVLLFFAVPAIIKNKKTKSDLLSTNPAYSAYITAHTSGIISNESVIRIIFTNEIKNIETGKPLTEKLFDFSEGISGVTVWVDNRTLEFRPEKRLASNTEYTAALKLNKIIPGIPDNLKLFEFQFKTIQQWFDVSIENIKTTDLQTLRRQKITGSLSTADGADKEAMHQLITATQNNKTLKITWEDIVNNSHTYRFSIDSIERGKAASSVIIKWNGKPLNIEHKGEKKIEVPSLDDFKVMNIQVVQSPDQYVVVQFSDPVNTKQNLDGLITVSGVSDLNYLIEGNQIKVFFPSRINGAKTVTVETSVKNCLGYPLKSKFSLELLFEELKPNIKLIGKGVILPNSKNLLFPFQAVNLKAVDVKIIKVYEKNIPQFFQINNLESSNELRRVGKLVLKKTIALTGQATNLNKWNNFSLDLVEQIKTEPGAIYKIILSFKKDYSLYACNATDNAAEIKTSLPYNNEETEKDWDYYSSYYNEYDYYNDYDYEYDYSQRNNPCHSMYYRDKVVSRTILASDIGIITKRGANGSMLFITTDLLTANPLPGIEIEVYDFQQQVMTTLKTNNEGIATFTSKEKPFLLVAKKGKQRGYLKLDDGSSLSLSMFDVSGQTVQKGIKGFIYGERGVWRPGDSLYLTFILEDKLKQLPKGHPVLFELYNPLGQLIKKNVKSVGENNFYNFSTATDDMAPTGNWLAKVKVGGVTFEKSLKIETVVPNRLKINLDFGTEKILLSGNINASLKAQWLTGITARNLKSRVAVMLTATKTKFKKYEDYTFDNPGIEFNADEQTIFDSHLDNEGNASFKPAINVHAAAPGMLAANFTVKVFEAGGNFSIDRFSVPYSPYQSYVGIKIPEGNNKWTKTLLADTAHTIKIVTVDENGKPVSRNLKIQMYHMNWRWWWQQDYNDMAAYVGKNYFDAYLTKNISSVNGSAQFTFTIPHNDWGRYFIVVTDETSGHSTGGTVYVDYWSGNDYDGLTRKGNEGASMLSFTSDKENYNTGENVIITIPATAEGKALISIENGSGVLKTQWITTSKGSTSYSFKASEEMSPNVYIHITLLQPHAQTKNDLPIRMYGVIPIRVENANTHLTPVLKMPNAWRPEEKASVTVLEQNGKEMDYTIAVVDEGLLDLTRFKTPDPWSFFYAREALGVKTWDLYDFVMGAFGGELQRILAIGGDGETNKKAGRKANRFKPMVKFMGPFHLKKGEKATHEFLIPQYVGSVRTMVIAGNNGAYGFTEKATPVKKPLMVLGTLPRVVGPSETVDLPVTVFAMEKNIKNVTIQVNTNNLFSVEDNANKTLAFSQTGDQVVNFKLKVKPVTGIGKVKITVSSGSEKAVHDIEIESRNPNPKITTIAETVIEPGKSWTQAYTPAGITGTNKATIELSSMPPINLEKRLKYLIEYPHGCIEQITSAVFPQLFLSDISELNSDKKVAIDRNIKAALEKYRSYQLSNGGFAYWPGGDYVSDWGTNYAGYFLLEAEFKGYVLPANVFDNWKRYQKQRANSWTIDNNEYYYSSDLDQAYRLYTLALAKAPELGAMNRLKEYQKLSLAAKWRLAGAYALCGQIETAKSLTNSIPTGIPQYTEMDYTYGSSERDEAMILETLTLMKNKTQAATLAKKIAAVLSNNIWLSTQTTAYCLISISNYLKLVGNTSNEMSYSYSLNNMPADNLITRLPLKQISIKDADKSGTAAISNKGKGVLYARIILEGIPATDNKTDEESNLKMQVIYNKMNGAPLDPSKIEQGTDFVATVTFYNPGNKGDYKQMALTQIFPSGWQIHNTRMDEQEIKATAENNDEETERSLTSKNKISIPTYQDIRDDRVYTYFDLRAGETKTFKIVLNASFTGKFYLPTVYCEAMYDNSVRARRSGKWVEVIKSGGDL